MLGTGIGSALLTIQPQLLSIRPFFLSSLRLMLMSSSYAPAFQRYGSQISAIHFIGPEKPWNAIPIRPPSLAENPATSSASSSGTTYDYQSLVDRWFAVYDKHYRSQPPATSPFQPKHYPSVWNTLSSTTPSALLSSGSHFTLDDLRKMSIEGMSGAGFDNTSPPGEGEYRSLPLEGRFDLMRPRKPLLNESDDDSLSISGPSLSPDLKMEMDYFSSERDLPVTPVPRHLGLPEDPDPVIWHTLPAPGPPKRSLPTTPMTISDYYASSAGQTSDEEDWDLPDNSTGYPSFFSSPLFQQLSTSQPPSRTASQHLHPLDRGQDYHNNQGYHEHHGSLHSLEQRDAGQAPGRGSHPSSLVQLSWNPAVEPPPNNFLPHSRIPADTSFTNAWDLQHQEHTRKGVAFQTYFPEPSLEQGPHRNAIGHTSPMSFGHSKAKSIFPWEDERRLRPSRVFPELDIPSSAKFVGQTNPMTPLTPKPLDRNGAESSSIPKTLSFTNAWDGDRGIQNYASRLVRTPAPHSNVGDWRGTAWDEKVEANSQDGDDEDERDENENDSEDNDTRRRARTRMVSVVQNAKEAQKPGQKTYRSSGTQTVPREKRSQGVQKSTLTEVPANQTSRRPSISGTGSLASGSGLNDFQGHADSDSKILFKHGRFSATNGIRSRSISSGSYGKSSLPLEHDRRPQRGVTMPSSSYPQRLPAGSLPSHVHEPLTVPKPPRASRPRLMSTPGKFVPPPKARSSSQINTNAPPAKAPSISQRYVLNDLPIGVPPSWIGVASPPLEDRPPVRKGMRTWDPARGVELFKRGSEQVLARFLKMDSWDENENENDRGES